MILVLVFSSLLLIPGQSTAMNGFEIVVVGSVVWVQATLRNIANLRRQDLQNRGHFIEHVAFLQLALIPCLIAGIILLTGNSAGLYWLAAGILLCIVKAVTDAWVLLVEINR